MYRCEPEMPCGFGREGCLDVHDKKECRDKGQYVGVMKVFKRQHMGQVGCKST